MGTHIDYFATLIMNGGKPSDCVRFKQCEQIFPQHLPVTEYLHKIVEANRDSGPADGRNNRRIMGCEKDSDFTGQSPQERQYRLLADEFARDAVKSGH